LSAKPIILKLGGSVITRKEKPLTANLRAIRRLASEISSAEVAPLILVHGGGSFGHPLAKRYAIKEGYKNKASQALGFALTHQAMVALNKLVVDALIDEKIPAVAVSPSSCIVAKSGRIATMSEGPLKKLLQMGFVPILFGDAVLDSDLGFTILSGDQLIAYLAMQFNAKRIIVGIDVDGLYTADPKTDSSAKLVSHVTLKELKNMRQQIEKTKVTDVTGGMLGKIEELMPPVERGIEVLIVNAAKPNNIYKALKSEKVTGTLIERDEDSCPKK
jgi:isopentenyl phosphate kinase